jgi:hypothetical protein
VAARLTQMATALGALGLTVVHQATYRDDSGDGTGSMAWLWVRAEPRRFPDEDHDVIVTYSEADSDWSLATPGGRYLRVQATGDSDVIAQTVAAAVGTGSDDLHTRDVPDWVSLLLSGAATGVIIPFVQAVIGKSAEDAYASLRSLLGRRKPLAVSTDDGNIDSKYLSIVDPEENIQLVVPDPVPLAAVRQLAAMDRSELRGQILVWDRSRQEWYRCRRT